MRALRFGILFLALSSMGASSCSITREQIDAITFLNNTHHLIEETQLCQQVPELNDYGFYRKLDTGQIEFISFCNPLAPEMLGVMPKDLNELLNGTIKGAVSGQN